MGSQPKAPPAPDPVATASAQGAVNRDAALTQQQINMVDQYTPDGSLKYNRIDGGDYTYTDSLTGKQITVPRYSATQSYSPEAQARIDQQNQIDSNLNQIALNQSGRVDQLLSTPFNLDNKAAEDRIDALGRNRLDPRFQREEEQLKSSLANQGIRLGSDAYKNAFDQFAQSKNDAYNQLALTGRGQAIQEALTERNQPLNEISALLNGGQVSQPNFINAPQQNLAAADYQGAVNTKYQGDMNAYNQKVSQNNAMLGGLFGMAGTIGSAFVPKPSDKRLKTDIKQIGTSDNGLPIYLYRYIGSQQFEIGLMAQDVAEVKPEAIHHADGFMNVDYKLALEA